MTTRLQIVFDCASPTQMAAFWAAALRFELAAPPHGFQSWNAYYRSIGVPYEELEGEPDEPDRVVDPAGIAPRMWFQKVPEPKTVKNRVHLDITAAGADSLSGKARKPAVDTEVARLRDLGATVFFVHDEPGMDHYAVTMQDPEGNEFCVH